MVHGIGAACMVMQLYLSIYIDVVREYTAGPTPGNSKYFSACQSGDGGAK
jgi:hypothetical protein